jgi:hypothetical protein
MTKLGARPLNPPPPAPAPAPEPGPSPEQVAQRAAEQEDFRQWESQLDGHLAHLRSLDPNSENFAPDMLDALDLVDHHVGGSSDRIAELRDQVSKGIAAKARADLEEHLRWAETSFPPGIDRTRAALHGFNLHLDQLDQIEDAALIEFGKQALGIRDPQANDDR